MVGTRAQTAGVVAVSGLLVACLVGTRPGLALLVTAIALLLLVACIVIAVWRPHLRVPWPAMAFLVSAGIFTPLVSSAVAAVRARHRAEAVEAARLDAANRAALRASAPARMAEAAGLLRSMESAYAAGNYASAAANGRLARDRLADLDRISPAPTELPALSARISTGLQSAQNMADAAFTIAAATRLVGGEPSDDASAYDTQLSQASAALASLPPIARDRFARDTQRLTATIARRRREIAPRVERERREAAARSALAERCGDAPALSPLDGELYGAARFVARSAHDPDSIDVENCTPPVLSEEHCWTTTCSVRGNNAFGARVLNRIRFYVGPENHILGTSR